MTRRGHLQHELAVSLMAALLILAHPTLAHTTPADAGWLGSIWSQITSSGVPGEPGSDAGIAAATAALKNLPPPPRNHAVLAAHAGAEGHWAFANSRGETFTVATPDEMRRVVATLAPEAAEAKSPSPQIPLSIHLTYSSASDRTAMLKDLPSGARLFVLHGRNSYPLAATGRGTEQRWHAAVHSRLHLEISQRPVFDEALRQLARPLDKHLLRVLSLEPDGPKALVRWPKPDPKTGRLPTDVIDPYKLPAALSSLRGQAAVISGRIDGDYLYFRPSSGKETTLLSADVTGAAARAGVDLLFVQSSMPHQPGGRNWLWLRFDIDGLNRAMDHATFGDFLETLAGGRGNITLAARNISPDRLALEVRPPPPAVERLSGMLRDVATGITGNVSPTSIVAYLVTVEHRRELSLRLVPMIPSTWQATYLACLMLSALGLTVAHRWWSRLWPAEQADEYASRAAFLAARATRMLMFLCLFLPLVGPAALLATLGGLLTKALSGLSSRPVPSNPQIGSSGTK